MKKRIPNVLFLWDVDSNSALRDHLSKNLSKDAVLVFPEKNFEKIKETLYMNADAIVGWRPDKELLLRAEKLKLFINPGTGVKHHIDTFRQLNNLRKVRLVNGHGHSYATAQHAVAMLLAFINKIIPYHNQMVEGGWMTSDDSDLASASVLLRNRRIGLLGYGAINSKVHRFLSGFSVEFNIYKRRLDKNSPRIVKDNMGNNVNLFRHTELQKFLKKSDILIVAVPHTARTEGLIGLKELKLLGSEGIVVNVARGAVVNESDLYSALSKKIISGAALDVWYNYRPRKDKKGRSYPYSKPFHTLSNVLLSPHRAASPFDDLDRWDEVIENIKRLSAGKRKFLNEVNLEEEY